MEKKEKAYLLLENGTVLEGDSMGSRGKAFGTAAFHTGMVGYQQLLTAPASRGLMLVQTFPLVGNYGVNGEDGESDKVQASGYIVRECCGHPSNYRCQETLDSFLKRSGTVGICGVDTRHITKLLREQGEQKAVILSGKEFDKMALLSELKNWNPENAPLFSAACEKMPGAENGPKLAVMDFGASKSFFAALLSGGAGELQRFSAAATAEQLKAAAPDGIVLSDGPGDPADYPEAVAALAEILGLGIPILGISLGHQLMAIAAGMKTKRLKHGHRGANQPVLRLKDGRTYITDQNHGWVVDEGTVDPAVCTVSFQNSNDKTIEGLAYRKIPALSVQFLPDAGGGKQSTSFVYSEFLRLTVEKKGKVE